MNHREREGGRIITFNMDRERKSTELKAGHELSYS